MWYGGTGRTTVNSINAKWCSPFPVPRFCNATESRMDCISGAFYMPSMWVLLPQGVFLLPYRSGSYTGLREAEGLSLQANPVRLSYSRYNRTPGKAFRVERASHCSLESLFWGQRKPTVNKCPQTHCPDMSEKVSQLVECPLTLLSLSPVPFCLFVNRQWGALCMLSPQVCLSPKITRFFPSPPGFGTSQVSFLFPPAS